MESTQYLVCDSVSPANYNRDIEYIHENETLQRDLSSEGVIIK